MQNPVEYLLEQENVLSFKQFQKKLQLPKRMIKYYIYNSKKIKDRDPILHGSLKRKIHVYEFDKNFTGKLNYIEQKMENCRKKRKKNVTETNIVTEDPICVKNTVPDNEDYELV